MEFSDHQQQLIQFANEMEEIEQKRQQRIFEIILSNLDILNEIKTIKARLELLLLEEKKVAFYPHKLTIRQHITEAQTYLSDLCEAYSRIDNIDNNNNNNNHKQQYKQPVVKQKKEFQKKIDIMIDDLSQLMIEK